MRSSLILPLLSAVPTPCRAGANFYASNHGFAVTTSRPLTSSSLSARKRRKTKKPSRLSV